MPGFCVGTGSPNTGPHTHRTNTPSTEPSSPVLHTQSWYYQKAFSFFEQPEFVFIRRSCVLEVSTGHPPSPRWSLGQGQGCALGICLDGLSVTHGPCTECLLRFTGTERLSRESSRETRLVQVCVCVNNVSPTDGEISLKSKNCKNIWPQTSTNRIL